MFPLPHPLSPFLSTQLRGERFEGAPSLSFSPFLRFGISAGGDKISRSLHPAAPDRRGFIGSADSYPAIWHE